jgi:hypothetical protein
MKYINEKAPSVKSKIKDINKKIGKLVSKKEDAISKAKEMADSEEPSGKMQASLAKIQLRQSESEAEKLMLQKQAEILKAKIDTAKKKEKTTKDIDIEEMENRSITILEGVMSDIHQMINNHKNFDSFQKEFFKEYGHKKVMKKTPEFLEWLEALYNDSQFAVAEADAKPGPDPYMRGLDDDDEEKKEDKMKKQAEMDDDDPDAYKELPGDKEAKAKGEVKTSKHVKKYHELYGDKKDESVVTEAKGLPSHARNLSIKLKTHWLPDADNKDIYFLADTNKGQTITIDLSVRTGEYKVIDKKDNVIYQGGDPYAAAKLIESVEISEKAKPYAFVLNDWFNAVEKAGNFENIGKELKAAGYEFEFEDNKNNPAYKVEHDEATFAIANKKYWGRQWRAIEKQIGDIAIGWVFPNDTYNESNINEEKAEGDRGKIADAKIETALKTKAEETGVPIGLIRIIMRRGMAAWKTGHRPGASEQQWGYARVNAFLTKGEGTWGGADKDVAKEVRDGGHDKGLKERIESDIRLSDKVVAFKTDDSSFNGQSPNTITCNNCTWTWMKQDGGDDMYVCHKCGTNNAPLLGESTLNEEDTYNDYPAAAKKNAKKALDWRDEHGRDEVDAGTAVGWTRANQLAKGEKISADTVKRMASFNRHRKNSSIKAELKGTPWKDKGYVSWLIWGGDEGVDWAMKKSKEIDDMKKESKQMKYVKPLNEAEKYITDEFKVGDKIKTNFGEWEVIETDYAPNKSFIAPFVFKGKDMERVNIPNPPKTNKKAVGYKVTDGGKYPIIGFLYQYKDITKLATVGVDESVVNEKDKHTSTDFSKPGNNGDIYFSKREGDAVGIRLEDKLQMIYVFQEEPKLGRIQKTDKRWENMGPASEELLIDLRGRTNGKILFDFVSTLEESVVTEAFIDHDKMKYVKPLYEAKIKVTKDKWPYLEFKVGSKKHKVEFDYEDIIDDHGNEGQDQYWIGKDDEGQEWMIDVYANYMGDVEEVHYDTIVKESVSSEFSPMGYAKRVVSGAIKIKDAMKEAGISLANMAKLIKRIDKSFDVDAAFLEKNVMQDDPEKFVESSKRKLKYIRVLNEDYSQRARNFRVNLRTRLEAMKKGEKISYGKLAWTALGNGNFKDSKGRTVPYQDIVQDLKHAVKPDILRHRGASGADMVDAYLAFESKVNEGYWSSYEYDKWTKENGKPKYPKWVRTTLKEIVKGGFMEPVYDAEHNYMVLWLASLENKNRAELYAYDKKGEKALGKVGYAMYQRFYNDLTGYNMFFMQGAMYALEVSKNIKDRVANGEPVEPAYYMMKEFFNNMGMDTKRSRVFNAAYEKLEKWMKENSIPTL